LRAIIRNANSHNCHELRGSVSLAVIRIITLTRTDHKAHETAYSAGTKVNKAAIFLENVILKDPLGVLDPEERTEAKKQALGKIDELENALPRSIS